MPKITMKQFGHYAKAVTTYAANGFPKRSQDEVNTLLEICKSCDKFEDGRCVICGCRCNKSKLAYVNKLKMSTEHCPEGKW